MLVLTGFDLRQQKDKEQKNEMEDGKEGVLFARGARQAPLGDSGLIPLSLQLPRLSQLQLSTWQIILLSLGLNEGPCWE